MIATTSRSTIGMGSSGYVMVLHRLYLVRADSNDKEFTLIQRTIVVSIQTIEFCVGIGQ